MSNHMVVVLPVTQGGLIGLHVKLSGPPGSLGLNGFGGKVEDGESPRHTCQREMLEELGVTTDMDDYDFLEERVLGDGTVLHWFALCVPVPFRRKGQLGNLTVWMTVEQLRACQWVANGVTDMTENKQFEHWLGWWAQ